MRGKRPGDVVWVEVPGGDVVTAQKHIASHVHRAGMVASSLAFWATSSRVDPVRIIRVTLSARDQEAITNDDE